MFVVYPFIFKKESPKGYFIESVDIKEAYTGINKISENIIEVFLFIGVCYRIDVIERKIVEKEIVK